MGLEDAIGGRFRDEVPLRVGEAGGQFAWRRGGFVQSQLHLPVADVVRNPVPDLARPGPVILKALGATGPIGRILPVNVGRGMPSFCKVRRTGKCDCSTRRMISTPSDEGYLIRGLPIPNHAFFRGPARRQHHFVPRSATSLSFPQYVCQPPWQDYLQQLSLHQHSS